MVGISFIDKTIYIYLYYDNKMFGKNRNRLWLFYYYF
jgi:hypothetical protein